MGVGFYLNEAKDAAVPSNQVNLAPILRSAEILRDDAVALVPQVKVGFRLTTASDSEMLRFGLAQPARGRIQRTYDELGEPVHVSAAN